MMFLNSCFSFPLSLSLHKTNKYLIDELDIMQ